MAPNRTVGAFPISLHGDTRTAPTDRAPGGRRRALGAGDGRCSQAAAPARATGPAARRPTCRPRAHRPPGPRRPPRPGPPAATRFRPADAAGAGRRQRGPTPGVDLATDPGRPPGESRRHQRPQRRAPAAPAPATQRMVSADPSPAPPRPPAPVRVAGPARTGAGARRGVTRPPAARPPRPTRPPEAQTRAVLAVVLIFVVVLCLLAYCGLRSIGQQQRRPDPGPGRPEPHAARSRRRPQQPPRRRAPARRPVLRCASSRRSGFDPQGDGSEKESLTKLAYDAKPSTGWTSDTYQSTAWGGLKKGVGLRLDLGSAKTVHSAQLRIGGTGATIQLLAVDRQHASPGRPSWPSARRPRARSP